VRRFGLVPLFRWLGRWPRLRLCIGYCVCSTIAAVIYAQGTTRVVPFLQVIGSAVGLAAVSILFAVVTWYRADAVPGATFFLAVTVSLSYTIGFGVAALFLPGSARVGIILAIGGLFSIPVRILVMSMILGVLISLGRRLRHFFAPETIEGVPHGT